MKLIFSVFLLLLAACTTLHMDHGYFLDKQATDPGIQAGCRRQQNPSETIHVPVKETEFTLYVHYQTGNGLFGFLGIPFIPVFWNGFGEQSILANVEYDKSKLSMEGTIWKLKVEDESQWIKGTMSLGWQVYFPTETYVPDKIQISVENLMLAGVEIRRTVSFVRDSGLHYVPMVMLHTEWPYGSTECENPPKPSA